MEDGIMRNKKWTLLMLGSCAVRVIECVDMSRQCCRLLKRRVHYSDFLEPSSERRLARTKQTRRKTKSELAEEKRLKEEEEKKKQEQELLDEEMKKKAKEKESRKTKPGNLFILVSEHCLVSETLKSVQLCLDQIGKAGAKRKQSEG